MEQFASLAALLLCLAGGSPGPAPGEDPVTQAEGDNWLSFGPGEFWPAT